ncbi:hypothetical protein WM11_11580 [Burkholderia ubonensis]|uniref:hypothetical protein n=1 Tax=Burkholderia ubonensis TaxID=101571 RepID=UPI0007580193|nr:hypothetical protein [Burkholderia ubonensis]KWK06026.1 hypothetical protein WM11_11580 [Burkholderia ubonensis]KWK56520.1 hypothetical protein WM14_27075 [Burkholderia ubonensis]
MILSLSHPRNLGSLAFVTGVTSIVWCLFVGWSGPSNANTGAILALAFALALDFGRRKKIAEIELDAKSDDTTSVRQILVNGVQVGTLPAREVAELKLGVALDPAIYASQFLAVGRTLLFGALLAFVVAPLLAIFAVLFNLWIDPHHTAQTALILSRTFQSLTDHGQVLDKFDSVAEATARYAGGNLDARNLSHRNPFAGELLSERFPPPLSLPSQATCQLRGRWCDTGAHSLTA